MKIKLSCYVATCLIIKLEEQASFPQSKLRRSTIKVYFIVCLGLFCCFFVVVFKNNVFLFNTKNLSFLYK